MKTRLSFSGATLLVSVLLVMACAHHLKSDSNYFFFELHCPGDYWIDCDDNYWDLSKYGYAFVKDYNGKHYLHHPKVKYYLNSCNTGYITRTWNVYDYHGNPHHCTQTIHVGDKHGDHPHIYWPNEHIDLHGCNPNTNPYALKDKFGYPHIYDSDCNLIGITYDDLVFHFGGGCKKIVRKWKVIDWCYYKPNNHHSKGVWYYTQVIKISNSEEPEVDIPDDVVVNSYNCKEKYVKVKPFKIINYACNGDLVIRNNSKHADHYGADASGVYPVGTTIVKFTLEFGCGYKKVYPVSVTVENSSAPVPICLGKLSIPLMAVDNDGDKVPDDGMLEIWAEDFNKDSYHPCHYGNLSYSFSPDPDDAFRVLTCEHVGINELQVWVTDSYGRQAYCTVFLDVQNNAANIPDCEETVDEAEVEDDPEVTHEEDDEETPQFEVSTFSGLFYLYADKTPLPGVHLELTGYGPDTNKAISLDTQIHSTVLDSFQNQSGAWLYVMSFDTVVTESQSTFADEIDRSSITGNDGRFAFEELPSQFTYTIDFSLKQNHSNRITSADATALYEHIMGMKVIDNPYSLMAADVDNSGSLNFADVSILLDYLLKEIENFPRDDQWIFIREDVAFNNSGNAWSDKIWHSVSDFKLKEKNEIVNFMTIEVGDVVNTEIEGRTTLSELTRKLEAPDLQNGPVSARIHPNPFSDNIHVKIYGSRGERTVLKIYDTQGKLKFEKSINFEENGEMSLPVHLENLNSGMYYYSLTGKDRMQSGKLIKS